MEGASPPRRPLYLAELSYPAALALKEERPVVLIPVGATEAHGPHLPLGTDVYLSEELARRVQAALWQRGASSVIAPSLAFAVTEFGAPFAGTVSLDAATATAFYTGVLAGLLRAGFQRLCLVNSHLEAAHVQTLRAACAEVERRSGQPVAFPDNTERRWARTLTDEFKRGSCHAGRYETSLLLAAAERSRLVDADKLRSLAANEEDFLRAVREGAGNFITAGGPQAYFGDPAAATIAEGNDIYARLATMVLTVVNETWPPAA